MGNAANAVNMSQSTGISEASCMLGAYGPERRQATKTQSWASMLQLMSACDRTLKTLLSNGALVVVIWPEVVQSKGTKGQSVSSGLESFLKPPMLWDPTTIVTISILFRPCKGHNGTVWNPQS